MERWKEEGSVRRRYRGEGGVGMRRRVERRNEVQGV